MQSPQNSKNKGPSGMTGFMIVWVGQIVSVLASSMTQFALTIWAFEKTGSATALAVVSTSFIIPFLLLSPIAGVMVDRYNRKLMMMLSDLFAVTATAGILILHATGALQMWHLYVAALVNGIGNCFQWPAYSATISTMLPKEKYNRANGMMSLIETGPSIISPMLASVLLPVIGLSGILSIDIVTFFIALGALLIVFIPQPERTTEVQAESGNIFREAAFGFKYIFARRGLLGLLTFFMVLNLLVGLGFNVLAPFILTRTGNDTLALGSTETALAIGAVVGSLLISLWGGFKRRTTSIFVSEFMTGFVGLILFGLARSLWGWWAAAAVSAIFMPFSNGASQGIWQSKVAPDVQGRVFAVRRMIALALNPITPIIAGLLADYVTEPAMKTGGWFASTFGWLVGTDPGAGMAVQFIIAGVLYVLTVIIVYFFVPAVRNLEDDLPDHDQMKKVEEPSAA